ncbi:MAG: beta-lactamase family protein [Actinobacteria bacterium]|nr:beta-lactamase family protein [Actinomycetota bacterium]
MIRARAAAALAAAVSLVAATPGLPARTATDAARPASGAAATRTAADPGTRPWVQVPRDRVAEECGLDPELMDEASRQLVHTPFAVVRYGTLCWTGGYPTGATATYPVHSITKTFGALLVGMVADRSSLSDADPITRWVPADELGDINPEATIAHVLAMTATKPDLRHGEKGTWSYDALGEREINVLVGAMDRAIAEEPEGFPGVENVRELATEELFAPLGMTSSTWRGENIAYSLKSSQHDLARLGLLLLRKGRWNGEQIVSERWVYRMTHPAFEDTNTGYGYLTYVNAAQGQVYSSGTTDLACSPFTRWASYPHGPTFEAPDDNGGFPFATQRHDVGMFWAAGAGGQKTSVHRALDLVITVRDEAVSVGGGTSGSFEGHKRPWNLIRPALVAHDPVFPGDEAAFCDAYRRSEHAPDLRSPWSAQASGPLSERVAGR